MLISKSRLIQFGTTTIILPTNIYTTTIVTIVVIYDISVSLPKLQHSTSDLSIHVVKEIVTNGTPHPLNFDLETTFVSQLTANESYV